MRSPAPRASRARRGAALGLLLGVALGGCANPFSPEGTDPGVYKGDADPLSEGPADARDATLRERFELIQGR